jgi:hypothetical protein
MFLAMSQAILGRNATLFPNGMFIRFKDSLSLLRIAEKSMSPAADQTR